MSDQGSAITDDQLRAIWRDAGGGFHGPRVETGTMPEAKLLPFLRSLIEQRDSAVEELTRTALDYLALDAQATEALARVEMLAGAGRALLADCTYHLEKYRPGPLLEFRQSLASLKEPSDAG